MEDMASAEAMFDLIRTYLLFCILVSIDTF